MTRNLLGCILLLLAATAVSAQEPAETTTWESKRGFYRVSFTSSIEPIAINKIHTWVVTIIRADGTAVEGATLSVAGGMPEHDHGLPTRPRVTEEIGDGAYRIQGMRFHMAGAWSIDISIDDGERTDSVSISLVL